MRVGGVMGHTRAHEAPDIAFSFVECGRLQPVAGRCLGGAGTTQFSTAGYDTNAYVYATGATDFIASITLKVNASSVDRYEPGLTFSVFGTTDPIFFPVDLATNLTIGPTQVYWGDGNGGSSAIDTTAAFHTYAFRYLNGNLDLYIDASFDSIANGTATPALSRPGATPYAGFDLPGVIVFGDSTNDDGFNSDFIVDAVQFQSLDATTTVPEPTTLSMLGVGIAGLVVRRRRARQADL